MTNCHWLITSMCRWASTPCKARCDNILVYTIQWRTTKNKKREIILYQETMEIFYTLRAAIIKTFLSSQISQYGNFKSRYTLLLYLFVYFLFYSWKCDFSFSFFTRIKRKKLYTCPHIIIQTFFKKNILLKYHERERQRQRRTWVIMSFICSIWSDTRGWWVGRRHRRSSMSWRYSWQ